MLRLKAICYDSMNAEWDVISQRAEEWWLHACMQFRGIEVHRRLNGYDKIDLLGIAGAPDSDS